jgi:predicted transcriptional regulator
MTTIRLPVEFEQKLEAMSKVRHKTKSDLIKEALENFFTTTKKSKNLSKTDPLRGTAFAYRDSF